MLAKVIYFSCQSHYLRYNKKRKERTQNVPERTQNVTEKWEKWGGRARVGARSSVAGATPRASFGGATAIVELSWMVLSSRRSAAAFGGQNDLLKEQLMESERSRDLAKVLSLTPKVVVGAEVVGHTQGEAAKVVRLALERRRGRMSYARST